MIKDYKIINIDKTQVLLIDINLSFEFARELGARRNKNKLISRISNYLQENKIRFNGKKIVLLASGLTLGTIILNNKINNDYQITDYNYITNVVKEVGYFDIDQEVKEEIKISENLQIESTPIIYMSTEQNETKSNPVMMSKEEYLTMVDVNLSNGTILTIELEEYLIGVLGAEMPASFNTEALRAGAIVARTYALKSIETGKKLTDTVETQTYKDNEALKKIWDEEYTKYYNKIKSAVNSTKGMYITYQGEIIEAVYHSTSNGYTEDAINVWGNSFPYLKSVISPWDIAASSYLRNEIISYSKLTESLEIIVDQNSIINLKKDSNNRVTEVKINNTIISGVEFREKINIRSTDFDIEKTDMGLSITTKGYGHGVGMSQYGANGMAKEGYIAEAIIKHYYKGVTISKM